MLIDEVLDDVFTCELGVLGVARFGPSNRTHLKVDERGFWLHTQVRDSGRTQLPPGTGILNTFSTPIQLLSHHQYGVGVHKSGQCCGFRLEEQALVVFVHFEAVS